MTKPKSTHGGPGRGGGRKPVGSAPTIRKNVSLPPETIAKARKIGAGNVSEGVRRAVAEYPMDDEPLSNP